MSLKIRWDTSTSFFIFFYIFLRFFSWKFFIFSFFSGNISGGSSGYVSGASSGSTSSGYLAGSSSGSTSGSSSSSSSSSPSAAISPRKTPHVKQPSGSSTLPVISDVINAELRLFINSGLHEIQVQASGAHKATVDVSLPSDKFASFTFENLKKRFGSNWPALKPGGTLSTTSGKIAFSDTQALKELGIDVTDNSTKTFDVIFNVK